MRRLLAVLLLLSACSADPKKEELAPLPLPPSSTAVTSVYEGTIQTEYGEGQVELSLEEAETGLTSSFQLKGELASKFMFGLVVGQYTVLDGAENNEVILQLHGKVFTAIKPISKKTKNPPKLETRDLELYFRSEGGNKLVLVDEDFDPIADDARYTLYKRSRLFTAEGYITFEEGRTDFFEQNTSEKWRVAPLGKFQLAKKIYDSLATEEFEGIYLKALAYSVEDDSTEKELLVIKSILEMHKSKSYTDKEKAADLGYK